MALARKEVRITFAIKDKATGEVTRITDKIQRGFRRVTTTTQQTIEGTRKAVTTTRTYIDTQKTLGRRLGEVTQSLSRWGRRIGFTGFILSFTARRIIRSVQGITEQFLKMGLEMADVDKATTWLAETLEKLALAGMLTKDKAQEVIDVFTKWFDASIDLEGKLADIDIVLTDIKTAIAIGISEGLDSLIEKMGDVDWESFTEDVKDAAKSLTEDLVDAVFMVIGEDEEGESEQGV